MPRKAAPLHFATEADAIAALVELQVARREANDGKRTADRIVAAINEYLDEHQLTKLTDFEHGITLTRDTRNKPATLDVASIPVDLLEWAAQVGALVGAMEAINHLPESANRDRLRRFVMPGGTTTALVFSQEDDD